jgi:toxin ParE1/3/4
MPPPKPIKFSPKAIEDIQNILLYTLKTWGEFQTRKYNNSLQKTFELMSTNPLIGIEQPELEARMLVVEQHRIFYSVDDNYIFIQRIVHKKMSMSSH